MEGTFMDNFTPVNLLVLVSSILIGGYCLKKSFSGIFVRYRWVVGIVAFGFSYDVAMGDASRLHMLPFALILWGIFLISYQILLGKREPKDADEVTLEEIENIRKKKRASKSSIFDIRNDKDDASGHEEEDK